MGWSSPRLRHVRQQRVRLDVARQRSEGVDPQSGRGHLRHHRERATARCTRQPRASPALRTKKSWLHSTRRAGKTIWEFSYSGATQRHPVRSGIRPAQYSAYRWQSAVRGQLAQRASPSTRALANASGRTTSSKEFNAPLSARGYSGSPRSTTAPSSSRWAEPIRRSPPSIRRR